MSDISIQQQAAQPAVQTERAPHRGNQWRTTLTGFGFVLPFLIVYLLFLLWPILLGLRMSFFNWSLTGTGTTDFRGLANYQELFNDPHCWSSLGHTIVFTIISVPVLVLFGLALAILVNRIMRAQWVFRIAFFAPTALPITVAVIIWSWLYQPGFGLINSFLTSIGLKEVGWTTDPNVAMIAVIILTVWWTIGNNFVLYLAGLQQIPRELYESAAIDGAGGWAQIRWITFPLLGRISTLVLVLQAIASLQVFGQMYLLTSGGPNFSTRPVVEYIYDTGFTSFRVGYASAMSYVLFIIIVLITAIQFAVANRRSNAA